VEKVKVIYVHESVVSSVFKDVVTFGCLFALWFFNHRFCGGTGIIDFFVGLMVFVCAVGFSKKRHSPKEALDILTELARQDTTDTAKTSTNKPMPKLPQYAECVKETERVMHGIISDRERFAMHTVYEFIERQLSA
jgi:hypothetical protein